MKTFWAWLWLLICIGGFCIGYTIYLYEPEEVRKDKEAYGWWMQTESGHLTYVEKLIQVKEGYMDENSWTLYDVEIDSVAKYLVVHSFDGGVAIIKQ